MPGRKGLALLVMYTYIKRKRLIIYSIKIKLYSLYEGKAMYIL